MTIVAYVDDEMEMNEGKNVRRRTLRRVVQREKEHCTQETMDGKDWQNDEHCHAMGFSRSRNYNH